jgi:DNA-binding response OmpR family regulator
MPEDKPQAPRILIVEDEPMLALTIEELLVNAGFAIAGVAGRLEKALELIESVACDAAIVDANLACVSAGPVAVALDARAVPFIVLSGYSPEQLHGAFLGANFLRKPCRPARLLQTLNAILLKQ